MTIDADLLEELRRAEQEQLQKLRAERDAERGKLPPDALRWLALVPLLTAELGERAGFPTEGRSAREVLDDIHGLGLCEREASAPRLVMSGGRLRPVSTTPVYWMSRLQRRRVIEGTVEQQGVEPLAHQLGTVAKRLLQAEPPATVERWAMIAALAPDESAMAKRLEKRLEPLLSAGRFGEARHWVEAARLIRLPGDETFSLAVERMARRIELEHRRADDHRRLRDFLERSEQEDAFRSLVRERGPWALHYAGVGGVGKTTLLRRITSVLADEVDVITAGVDFDFLTPDYPLSKPAELLARFAEEFRLHVSNDSASGEFAAFDDQVHVLHEHLRPASSDAVPAPGAAGRDRSRLSPAAAIAGEDPLTQLIETFGLAIESLGRRVVLLLDTCEELARLRPDGSAPASVEVTFDILERLHDRVPSLRVVFCGRRPLASSGPGWRVVGSRHDPRPYLRLHEVRGFDRDGAERYLEETDVAEHLRGPILKRTGAEDARVRFLYDNEGDGPEIGIRRYNPFELALYGRWARDPEHPPTVKQILDPKSDPYVVVRLVGPLQDQALGELVFIVAVLGHFDRDVLAAVGGIGPVRFEQAYSWLIDTEWIDPQSGGWYEVQRGLRPRIMRYLRESDPAEFRARGRELLKRLRAYIAETPLDELDLSHLSAAARLLGADESEAWTWWRDLERRFAKAGDWIRTSQLSGMLLDERDPDASDDAADEGIDPDGALGGPVRATYAAAVGQVTPAADASTEWAAVDAWVDGHPQANAAAVLRLRARAGRVATAPIRAAAAPQDAIRGVSAAFAALNPGDLDEQLAASVVAALEALVDHARTDPTVALEGERLANELLATPLSAPLEAFTRCLVARLRLAASERDAAWTAFASAVARQAPRWSRQRWLDWRSPDDIGSRVRLELARAGFEPKVTLEAIGPIRAVPRSTLEGRWLLSAAINLSLALAPSAVHAGGLPAASVSAIVDEPQALVHLSVAPLALSLIDAVLAGGDAQSALTALAQARRRAEQARAPLSIQAGDILTLRALSRLRLRDEQLGAVTIGRQANSLREQQLLWQLDGLDGPKAASLFAPSRASERPARGAHWPAWRHARWRALYVGSRRRALDATAWAALALAHERHAVTRDGHSVLACSLDAIEANAVAAAIGCPPPCSETFEAADVARALALRERGEATHAFELVLRHAILTGDWRAEQEIMQLARQIGVRRAGVIACREGELLALRMPAQAVAMLERATDWLSEARDPMNLTLATAIAALTLVRAEDPGGARTWIERLEAPYRELAANEASGIPRWEELVAVAAAPTAERLDGLSPLAWRPWLIRIVALLAWRTPPSAGEPSVISAWVTRHYGLEGPAVSATPELAVSTTAAPAAVPVPAELHGWLGSSRPLQAPAPRPYNARPLLRAAVAIVSLLGWMAVGYGIARLTARAPVFSTVFLVVALTVLLFLTLALLRRLALRRSTVLLDVQPAEPLAGTTPAYKSRYAVRLSGTGPVVLGRHLPSAAWRLRITTEAMCSRGRPARDGAAALGPVAEALRRFARILGRSRMDVSLVLAPSAAWVPWEAMATLALGDAARTPGSMPLNFRRVPVRGRSPTPATAHPRRIVTLVSSLVDAAVAGSWAPAKPLAHDIHRLDQRLRLSREPGVHILHVVGALRDVGSGVRLQAGDALLRSTDLAVHYPGLELCVLQGATIPRTRLSSRDRDQAALLRSFASELAEHGVPAVMTLPPLSRELAAAALEAAAGELKPSRRLDHRGLQRAMRSAQAAMTPTDELDEQAFEAALQSCLYVAGDLLWVYRLLKLVAFEPILVSRIHGEESHVARADAR